MIDPTGRANALVAGVRFEPHNVNEAAQIEAGFGAMATAPHRGFRTTLLSQLPVVVNGLRGTRYALRLTGTSGRAGMAVEHDVVRGSGCVVYMTLIARQGCGDAERHLLAQIRDSVRQSAPAR